MTKIQKVKGKLSYIIGSIGLVAGLTCTAQIAQTQEPPKEQKTLCENATEQKKQKEKTEESPLFELDVEAEFESEYEDGITPINISQEDDFELDETSAPDSLVNSIGGYTDFQDFLTQTRALDLTELQKIRLVSQLGRLFAETYDYGQDRGQMMTHEYMFDALQQTANGNLTITGQCGPIMSFQARMFEELGFKGACLFDMRSQTARGHFDAAAKMSSGWVVTDYDEIIFTKTNNLYEAIEITHLIHGRTELTTKLYGPDNDLKLFHVTNDGRNIYEIMGINHEIDIITQDLWTELPQAKRQIILRTGNVKHYATINIPIWADKKKLNIEISGTVGSTKGQGYSPLETASMAGGNITISSNKDKDFFYKLNLGGFAIDLQQKGGREKTVMTKLDLILGSTLHPFKNSKLRFITGAYLALDVRGLNIFDNKTLNSIDSLYAGVSYQHRINNLTLGAQALIETRIMPNNPFEQNWHVFTTGQRISGLIEYDGENVRLRLEPYFTIRPWANEPGVMLELEHKPTQTQLDLQYQQNLSKEKEFLENEYHFRCGLHTRMFEIFNIGMRGEYKQEYSKPQIRFGIGIKKNF